MLREVKNKFRNIIVSTGATYDNEIDKTSKILKNKNYSFLHCVTIYPTPLNQLHLKRINYLKRYTKKVGFSDHSIGYGSNRNLASLFAMYNGAKMIERHIRILDKKDTKDGKVSIEPKDIYLIKKFSLLTKKDRKIIYKKILNIILTKLLAQKLENYQT